MTVLELGQAVGRVEKEIRQYRIQKILKMNLLRQLEAPMPLVMALTRAIEAHLPGPLIDQRLEQVEVYI